MRVDLLGPYVHPLEEKNKPTWRKAKRGLITVLKPLDGARIKEPLFHLASLFFSFVFCI